MFNYTPRLSDPTFKAGVQIYYDRLKIQALETNGTFLSRVFKERLSSEMYGFSPLNKLHDVFDTKFQQLVIGGLIDSYEKDYEEFLKPKRYEHLQRKGPQVLTMENLRASFVVWLVSVGLALLAFIFEWVRTLGEYFLVKSIFNTFYDRKVQEPRKKHLIFEKNLKQLC